MDNNQSLPIKKNVLIVEDESSLSSALQVKLTDLNLVINVAKDVITAKSYIQLNKPNLILLDIILPGAQNGFDLLEELKSQDSTKNIPVIVLTNLDSEKEVSKKIGANEYLIKSDVSLEEIKQKVVNYLK